MEFFSFFFVLLQEKVLKKKSGLEEIELGLARARAWIRRAVATHNYTSYKEENYVPRGAIYRNAYAFHQLRKLHTDINGFFE